MKQKICDALLSLIMLLAAASVPFMTGYSLLRWLDDAPDTTQAVSEQQRLQNEDWRNCMGGMLASDDDLYDYTSHLCGK